ncbi:hypothetical protein I8D64_05710 [Brachybacterium sp. MASK1Z-5]|uniref:DUF4175 domain-containing protein n=1 Tax=Brachybacterium halotolerans TaxID=2795215 RepID=A0ABS1B8E4_9MICO|nr:hypothetical protein [Brachybacterium halotolerans]MBK0330896.1 hypothetical protein [Brachybacterium halotolerans]
MYSWLFRHLPGPLWVRVVLVVALAVVLVGALFQWVFPAIAPHLPFDGGTVDSAPSP